MMQKNKRTNKSVHIHIEQCLQLCIITFLNVLFWCKMRRGCRQTMPQRILSRS